MRWWTRAGLSDEWCQAMEAMLVVGLSDTHVLAPLRAHREDLSLPEGWTLAEVVASTPYLVVELERTE